MNRLPLFFRWLTLAALADWLITRTLTRSAIFMPKSPPVIAGYQALTLIGQVAFTFASLLSLMTVGWIAWHCWRARRQFGPPFVLLSLALLSLFFLSVPPQGWLAAFYHLLLLIAIAWIGGEAWRAAPDIKIQMAGLAPALALAASGLYQLIPALYAAMRLPGPPPFVTLVFNIGELLVVLSSIGLWGAYVWRRDRLPLTTSWAIGLWASFPALAFSVMHFANPAITAIMAIWSIGLTLYLPWPIYAVSLWLAGATVIVCLRRGEAVGWAILLLAAGGYASQLSTQAFYSLIALWLLTSPTHQPTLIEALHPSRTDPPGSPTVALPSPQ